MKKRLVIYENGDRIIQVPPIWVTYHQTKIVKEFDLTHIKDEEVSKLRINPHDDKLLTEIDNRKNKS